MKYITDEAVKTAFVTMLRKLFFIKKEILQPFVEALSGGSDKKRLLALKELEDALEKNTEQKQVLTGLMTSGYLEPGVFNRQLQELNEKNSRLQKKKDALGKSIGASITGAEEAGKLLKYLSVPEPPETFKDEAFQEYAEQIVVISREEIEIRLKCGLHLRERLVD